MLTSLVGSLADQIAKQPQFMQLFRALFPDFDVTTTGGFLQFYAQMLFIITGYAGAAFVARWASDETDGRPQALLSTPLARARWVVAGGVGSWEFAGVVACLVIFVGDVALGAWGMTRRDVAH